MSKEYIPTRFLNILEHYVNILERENKELKEELSNWLVEDKLFEENKELKARIEICKENHIRYDIKAIDDNTKLRKENERLTMKLRDEIYYSKEYEKKAKADIKDLRKACKLLKEDKAIQYLKADNKKRLNDLNTHER